MGDIEGVGRNSLGELFGLLIIGLYPWCKRLD